MLVSTHISSRCCPCPPSEVRVLYVGCDVGLVIVLRNVLREPGYRIVTCPDRGSAILFLKSEIPYHLLLIDLEWRGTEGLKLAQLAHSLRHRKQMATLLVAATKLDRHLELVAHEAGIAECMIKTRDMSGVTKVMKRWLGTESSDLNIQLFGVTRHVWSD